jgi:hypothetical protein
VFPSRYQHDATRSARQGAQRTTPTLCQARLDRKESPPVRVMLPHFAADDRLGAILEPLQAQVIVATPAVDPRLPGPQSRQ